MTGMIENVLTLRYGPPAAFGSESTGEYRWNVGDKKLECILFKALSWDDRLRREFGILELLYGDARGGFLLGDSLKVAVLKGSTAFGLYQIEELQGQPEVRRALELESQICFFMDSANVWFYGLKNSELFVYDSGAHELDALGPVESSFQRLLSELADSSKE